MPISRKGRPNGGEKGKRWERRKRRRSLTSVPRLPCRFWPQAQQQSSVGNSSSRLTCESKSAQRPAAADFEARWQAPRKNHVAARARAPRRPSPSRDRAQAAAARILSPPAAPGAPFLFLGRSGAKFRASGSRRAAHAAAPGRSAYRARRAPPTFIG